MHSYKSNKEWNRIAPVEDAIWHPWRRWGCYVSERSWGTVREDYSETGDAWSYFPFQQAHQKAYRWGEDGIAGLCDRYQILVFSPVFWNEKDPILKERLFGLTTWEGNHGEDVKEYYYHLDAAPSFSYAKYLYKYPHNAFPYDKLYEENKKRGVSDLEYELIDTGVFDEDAYFDIFIEYAKKDEEDICIKIEAFNRGNSDAPLHILGDLRFRNQWSYQMEDIPKPLIEEADEGVLLADDTQMPSPKKLLFDYHLGKRYLYGSDKGKALFTNNETNHEAIGTGKNDTPHVKDAFHRYLIEKEENAVDPGRRGTKAALHYHFPKVPAKDSVTVLLRFTDKKMSNPLEDVEKVIEQRKKETDAFYATIHPKGATKEEKQVQRQALSGMIFSEQIYLFDVSQWITGDNPEKPLPKQRAEIRNNHWRHLNSKRILSMPDKWEYPWFASWDLAFQAISLSLVDPDFAKKQIWLLLFDQFLHPNGQIPAYEWEFSDVNPPVQAWAALKIVENEKKINGTEDLAFLERVFHRLLLNFSWWINVVDKQGKNVFEGGFLGLDNITVIDRSMKNLIEGDLDEADGAGWVAMFCLNLMQIALKLAKDNANYEPLATKFFEHFVYLAAALRKGYWRGYDMLDPEDKFFYSVIRHENGEIEQLKVRSVVGIIPLFATAVIHEEDIDGQKEFSFDFSWFLENRKDLVEKCIYPVEKGGKRYYLFSLVHPDELPDFLRYLWDPNEFRSDYGLRSLSKYHEKHPFEHSGKKMGYEPGESLERIKGGNSNWRGPIWFPINYLMIDSLKKLGELLDEEKVHVEGEEPVTISQMAEGFSDRLISLFTDSPRPIYSLWEKFQKDPHFSSYSLFFEHYHGDTGRGLGASHQTGWSALVANLISEFRKK